MLPLVLALVTHAAEVLPEVSVTEGLSGEFISTSCGRSESDDERLKLFTVADDFSRWPKAIRIDAGNSLGASGLAELLVAHQASDFAQVLELLGLQAVALGRRDLATLRGTLILAATALRASGLPFIASNLQCGESAASLCRQLVPLTLIESPDGPIAIISVLAPSVLEGVAKDRSADLELTDPKTALMVATKAARAQGAKRVIAIYDGSRGHELEDTLALAQQLGLEAEGERPGTLVALHLGETISSAQSPSSFNIVASVSGRAMRLWPSRETADAEREQAPLRHEALEEWSKHVGAWLCDTYASRGWVLGHRLDAQALTDSLLDVLRSRTGAEVAVFNRSAIVAPPLVKTKLTELDVVTTVPFDNELRVTRMPGAQLRKIIQHDLVAHDLALRGVTVSSTGELRVNSRLINDSQPYVVVTSDYLAAGGDGVITGPALRFENPGPLTTRSLWVDELTRRAGRGLTADAPIADPAKRARWLFRTTADLSFNLTRVVNPATGVYTDSQLSRSNAVAFRGDIEVRADADDADYTWENGLRLRYGLSRTEAASGAPTPLTETDDLMFLRDTATLRRWGPMAPAPYIPVPFIESYLESEFTAPATRAYHHLEWRPIAGLRLPLLPELSVFAGAGLDWETLALTGQRPLNEPAAAAVIAGGAVLRPTPLFSFGLTPVTGDGTLDVSWRDPGNTSSALVRLHLKVSVPIFQALALTLAYDLFARHLDAGLLSLNGGSAGWGFANDLVVGLSFRWAEPFQSRFF